MYAFHPIMLVLFNGYQVCGLEVQKVRKLRPFAGLSQGARMNVGLLSLGGESYIIHYHRSEMRNHRLITCCKSSRGKVWALAYITVLKHLELHLRLRLAKEAKRGYIPD